MFVVRRWPPVAVANQTATRMLFWETGNQTCSVISIWGCVKKNKLIYILMSVKKKSTLSYLCIKSYWKLGLHNHIETRTTPAKICVETGLSILINQILNYNFSELNFKLCGQIWYTNTYSCAVSRSWTSHLNKCSNSLQKSAFNAEITHRRNSNELPFSTSAIHREVNIQLNAKEL